MYLMKFNEGSTLMVEPVDFKFWNFDLVLISSDWFLHFHGGSFPYIGFTSIYFNLLNLLQLSINLLILTYPGFELSMIEPFDVGFCQDCNFSSFNLVLEHLKVSDHDHHVQIQNHQDQVQKGKHNQGSLIKIIKYWNGQIQHN